MCSCVGLVPDEDLHLSSGNDQNIQMLIYVAETLLSHLQATSNGTPRPGRPSPLAASQAAAEQAGPSPSISKVNDFLFVTGLDNVNLFRLVR